MLRTAAVAWFILFTSVPAMALEQIPGKQEFADLLGQDQNEAGMGIYYTNIDGRNYLQINPRFDFRLGPVAVGMQVPLLLGTNAEGDFDVRAEDWDEVGDYFKMLRYVQYGEKRDFIYARLGELTAKIGHGTIVRGYSNNTDINTFRLGLAFDLNMDLGGFESLFGDLVSLAEGGADSQFVAARAYVKPVGFLLPDSPLNIFALGLSVAADLNAPYSVDADGDGMMDFDPETNNTLVAESRGVTIVGLDVEAEVLNNSFIEMVPYLDVNFIADGGMGVHLGLDTTLKLPVGIDFQIPILLEYRHFQSDYIPMYFDTFYEIERFSLAGQAAVPKGQYLRSAALKDQEALNGIYGQLGFNFLGIASIAGKYEHYAKTEAELSLESLTGVELGKGTFALVLLVPALDVLQFEAYYRRTAITGASDLFQLDDRSMLVAQAKYQMYPFVYLVGQASRRWVLQGEAGYTAVDKFDVGVEFAYQF